MSVGQCCEALGVSRSGYYKYLKRTVPEKEKEDLELAQIILEYDLKYKHTLGYRRMTMYINILNQKNYSEKKIHRLMGILGVKAKIRRSRPGYRKVKPEMTAANILNREFKASKPNEKWLTDVTEFKYGQRKCYLSALLDLYDRSIVGYEIGHSNNNELVFKMFEKAVENNPAARPMIHSDRGFQYTSKMFNTKLSNQGCTQSMSRVARCIDNGPMEGFWGIVKSEMYYLNKYEDYDSLKSAIEQYIYYYNHERFQAGLKNMAPVQYRSHA
ncbi:MAG: IS3 family transposase [Spirochaetia bacterium]|nr:IS3 family transposase [Spirochaetia bacterium]